MIETKKSFNTTMDSEELDIYAVSVTLRALKEGIISRAHGYQTYALFLNILRLAEPSLAEELHRLDSTKPFTVSPLLGGFGRVKDGLRVAPDSMYRLRLTFLQSAVFTRFLDGILKWGDNTVDVSSVPFKIEEVNPGSKKDSMVGFQSYQGILNNASAEHHIELEFLLPTVFRSGGRRNVIFPEPQLVFGSYLNRWQAYASVKLDDSINTWIDRTILTRYRLETQMLNYGSYQEVGFMGRSHYELDKNTPDEVAIAVNALADFAFYCGTGAKTTMGMGQTKRVKRASSVSNRAGR